jgi:hypothetical protein
MVRKNVLLDHISGDKGKTVNYSVFGRSEPISFRWASEAQRMVVTVELTPSTLRAANVSVCRTCVGTKRSPIDCGGGTNRLLEYPENRDAFRSGSQQ